MATFLSFPIMALAAILQATFVPQIRLLGGGPDIPYLIVLAWGINADLDSSVLWAFVGGIMVDLMSSNALGTSTFGMLFLVFAINGLGQQVYRIGPLTLVALVLFGTIFQQIVLLALTIFAGYRVDWLFSLGYVVAPTIFYNLIFIWPVYWFIRRIQRRIERRGGGTRVS